jgi:tRNA threonylcarbamoyladenosine biosynthesis protein TsaB
MALILNIETATRNCSVALGKDGEAIAVNEIAGEGYLHAEKLHVFIQDTLTQAGFAFKDLTAIAVSMGPGSYTGLRIGVSAAKGLCYALNIPLIAVDTLEVMAMQVSAEKDELIVPLIDARRMEAYTAVFDSAYNKLKNTEAEIITVDSFGDFAGTLHLVGDGAAKCKEVLSGENYIYHDDVLFPSAREMCRLSEDKIKIGDTVDVAYFEPFYLKDFIAGKKLQ